ncbi:MAG: hypothetical protein WD991_02485 [Candidatus Paceibacterota bacterium]
MSHNPLNTGNAPASEGGGPKAVIQAGLVFVSIFLLIGFLYVVWWNADEIETPTNATPPPAPVEMVEALVLEHECLTPCSADIAWRFKIRTDGRPLSVKFQGVGQAVTYPGEGDFKAPSSMRSGETQFVSPDESHPHVRVQVYRKVTVPSGR